VGPVSNTTIVRWLGPYSGPDYSTGKITDCSTNPSDPICQLPAAKPKPYIVDLVEYHPINPGQNGHYGCFIVTETTTVGGAGGVGPQLTFPEGKSLCPPKPKEPSLLEAVVGWIVDAVDWVSNAYKALKEEVISFVANFVPAELCDKSCLGFILDATLAAMGIPPSIPNFDQLMNEGLDYLAQTAVEQIGVPKEIHDLAAGPAKDFAIEQFQKEAKAKLKQGMQEGLLAAQKALSSEVSWIPDGVPIKPDPLGEVQPAGLAFKVTRDPAIEGTCTGNMLVWVTAENGTPEAKEEIGPLWSNLFEQVYLPIPDLEPGESVTVPVTLKPALKWGTKYAGFSEAFEGWYKMYNGAEAQISVTGPSCLQGDGMTTPAKGLQAALQP
jgi:hypothetical protein